MTFKTVITFLLRVKSTNISLYCVLESDLDKNNPKAFRCGGDRHDRRGLKSLKKLRRIILGLSLFLHAQP